MSVRSQNPRVTALGRLIALALAIGVGGFLGGLVLGPILLPPPPPEPDPGEMEWPLIIRVNFEGVPENVSLDLTLSVVKENRTLGSSRYIVNRPVEGPDLVFLSFTQVLPAVPQTLKVVLKFGPSASFYSWSTRSFDVFPVGSCASPQPFFLFHWGSPVSHIPGPDLWLVSSETVGGGCW